MEPLQIPSTQNQVPDVELDPDAGVLTFAGQCYMDNADKFFDPIFNWLEEFLDVYDQDILFEMQLEYFNTSSAKCLWEIFMRLERYQKEKGATAIVQWYFEEDDENTWDLFEDFKAEVAIKFVHVDELP